MELLRPIQERRRLLAADPAAVATLLAVGADKARTTAAATYRRVSEAMGLLSPG